MAITVQGDTFTGSVGTPWNIPAGVAIFVQPGSGGKVIDYDTTRQNYMSMYGTDPLGQVQPNQNASPGSANYEMSRTYYSNNPSQRFQDLNAQYQQQQGNTLTFGMYSSSGISRQSTSEPTPVYDMSTAAGIAAYTARQGGTVTADTARIAFQEGYIGSLNVVSGMSTVLIPDKAALAQGNALTIPASVLPGSTVTTYVPYGSYAQTELLNTKDIINQISGEIGIYQLSKGGYYYKLIGGGGIGSLQSGMFTIGSPETPVVYTQESAGKVLAASANATGAAYVLANESAYSRLGAEVYGGYVTKLTGATVESTGAQLSTYANQFNLANYVSPTGVNLSKADMNLFSLPWTISPNTSAVMAIGKGGNVTGLQLPAGVEETFMPSTQVAAIGPTIITKSDTTQEIGGLTFTLLGTAENVLGTGTKAAAEQTTVLDQVGSFLSGAVNFWTPTGIAGTKNVVEGSVPIVGDIPYIGSTINSVAAWVTPQGMAQVTTPAGLQVQKDASTALSDIQAIKAQYEVAKGQYDIDFAAAKTGGYINSEGKITDSATYTKLSGEIDSVNALASKLNEANTKYTSVYEKAVSEGLYTVDKSGNYVPTVKAQSSAMDLMDISASGILKNAGFTVSTDYSKIEQKPVIQTPLYDIYQSFEKSFAQPFTIGAATEVQEKPASAAFNFAVGVGLALATEGFSSVVARSATLSRVGGVVSPTIYTTRAGTEIRLVPAALSGIYAASVPYRATDELTNFEPKEVSKNLGGILATETGPMIAGAYFGTEAYVRAVPAISRGATQFSDWISTPSGGWREEAVFSPGGVGGRTIQVGEAEKTAPFTKEEFIKTFDVPVSVQTYAESMGLNLEQAAYLSEQLGARGGNVFGSSGISELVGSGELSLEPPAGYRAYMKSRLQESGAITPSLGAIERIPAVSENLPIIDINLKGASEYLVPTINNDYYTQMKYTQRLEPVTATERNMIITQYELTPIEIETAKMYGQTLNDVLAYREYVAALKEPVLVQKAELSDLVLRQDVKFGSTGKYATEVYPELGDILSSRRITGTESYLLSRGVLPSTIQSEIAQTSLLSGVSTGQLSQSQQVLSQVVQQDLLNDVISDTLGKQATTQMEQQAQLEAQVTDQSIIQDILGKQAVTSDVTQDTLGKQIIQAIGIISPIEEISPPEVTNVPPVEPVKIEPIPDIPIFPIFQLPWGQGGSGGSLKRRRKYLEYFPVGLDISSFGIMKGSNPFTSPVGERKYYPVESYGLPRESKTPRAYKPPAQRKAPKLKRRRTNIFF